MLPPDARLGFCCKFIPPEDPSHTTKVAAARAAAAMNLTTITMAHLEKLGDKALDKVVAAVSHNIEAQLAQLRHVAARPPIERLLRMASTLLPAYNHPVHRKLYDDPGLRGLVETGLARIGELARARGVRVSLHPSQFCVIASENETALANGLSEMEYHADVMRMMGYGIGWHPDGAHINIHGGARAPGIEGFRAGLKRLSETARNLVTVENDEVSYGLDDLLPLADDLPIVLDLHHHWIASGGEYIEPDDPRVARVLASWRGVRPISHISVSREDLLPGHDPLVRPDYQALAASGLKMRDLRAHSDMMWNLGVNDLVARHLAWSDFEIEAKAKNLASEQIARHVEAVMARAEAAE